MLSFDPFFSGSGISLAYAGLLFNPQTNIMTTQKIFSGALLIASAALIMTGCKKDNNDPSGITYKLQTSNRTTYVARVEAGNIQWTSGFGNASEVKFEAKGTNGEIEYKSSTQQHINLFSGISTLGNLTLPAGTYREVEFKVELNPTPTEPALELAGTYTSTGPATPVIFRVSSSLELKTERNDVTITTNNGYSALTTLNLSLLGSGIGNLTSCFCGIRPSP